VRTGRLGWGAVAANCRSVAADHEHACVSQRTPADIRSQPITRCPQQSRNSWLGCFCSAITASSVATQACCLSAVLVTVRQLASSPAICMHACMLGECVPPTPATCIPHSSPVPLCVPAARARWGPSHGPQTCQGKPLEGRSGGPGRH
jgi:hypothetical protein